MYAKKCLNRRKVKIIAFVLVIAALALSIPAAAAPIEISNQNMNFDCKSAILMEAKTGSVLYEQDADIALPPASVTKVMTLLLVMEAIEDGKIKYDDRVRAS